LESILERRSVEFIDRYEQHLQLAFEQHQLDRVALEQHQPGLFEFESTLSERSRFDQLEPVVWRDELFEPEYHQ
jgi:hypothetical protein